jgi:hypothetical protein
MNVHMLVLLGRPPSSANRMLVSHPPLEGPWLRGAPTFGNRRTLSESCFTMRRWRCVISGAIHCLWRVWFPCVVELCCLHATPLRFPTPQKDVGLSILQQLGYRFSRTERRTSHRISREYDFAGPQASNSSFASQISNSSFATQSRTSLTPRWPTVPSNYLLGLV